MKKLLLLPLLLSICLSVSAQLSADLSFGALTCGYDSALGDYYEVEIILDNRFVAPCAGFQFEITNILIDSLYGGWLDQYGWGPFTSFNPSYAVDTGFVLAFAFGPPYLPPDSGVLTMMRFTNPNKHNSSCLTNFTYADSVPNAVPTSLGPCLDLSLNSSNQTSVICNGDSIMLGGMYQYMAGSYYDTLAALNGCDSVIRTTLTVNASYEFWNTVTICSGDTAIIGSTFYTDAGIYYDSLQTATLCDSVYVVEIIVNATYEILDTASICLGDSIIIGSVFYSDPGTYYDSMLTVKGCDSVLIWEIVVNANYETLDTTDICTGDSIMIGSTFYSDAGTYYDTLQSAEGCDSVLVIELNLDALPVPVITQTGNDLTSSSAMSYQWYSSSTALVGETNQTYTATISGAYSVMVTDANGCSGSSDTLQVTVAVGLEEISVLPMLRIFPNPIEDQAIVHFDPSVFKGPYTILVYNLMGKKLLEEPMTSESQAIIQRNDLAPGIYFIELAGESRTLVGKFTIK